MRFSLTPRLAVLSLAHFTIDLYSSFYLPLLPLLVHRLGLNYTMVGSLVALGSMSSSFAQPLFGVLSDRLSRPWFVALGPLVAAVFLAHIGGAPTYAALVALLVAGGFGVAAFHPQAATLAATSGPSRGMAMSFWVTGGTLGWALGPMFASQSARLFGLERTWIAAAPGVLLSLGLLFWLARVKAAPHAVRARTRLSDLAPVARPLLFIYLTVVTRSAVSAGFATFLPLYVHERGWSVEAGGLLTTVYLTCGALGGFVGGTIADRVGGRKVVRASFLLAMPFFAAFFLLPERAGMVCLVTGYAFLQSSLPVNVVLGQELSPRHASTISSLLMGAAWGLGALIVGPTGALADRTNLRFALMMLSGLILVGWACAQAIPAMAAAESSTNGDRRIGSIP